MASCSTTVYRGEGAYDDPGQEYRVDGNGYRTRVIERDDDRDDDDDDDDHDTRRSRAYIRSSEGTRVIAPPAATITRSYSRRGLDNRVYHRDDDDDDDDRD